MQKTFKTQTDLFISASTLDHPILHSLDDTEALLEWSEIEQLLSPIYSSKTGCPSYPLITLFRSLLLGIWYQLSDVQLVQCLYRDLLFRKFCHLELSGSAPEASTIGRFRARLVEHDLWDRLLAEVNGQLETQNIIMTQGRINIIDATPVEAARSGPGNGADGQPKRDSEAGWHVRNDSRGRKSQPMAFQCIPVLMKMVLYIGKELHQVILMTAKNVTPCSLETKVHCMQMPPIPQKILERPP